ncbi:MAG: hypothetical protein M1834_002243 [Cirrosporium novae-zelandiae]|nr:MAG: hypothetical protein M1834_002243 [Cirrosporium novae-zelandiae]
MEPPAKPSTPTSLFQVYLRLRPPPSSTASAERFLTVEAPEANIDSSTPTHITVQPPADSRKRAVEKFAFTKVFEEAASQLDIFTGAKALQIVGGVLGEQRDGLIATLGVTGSGKSHTILGSKTQRGLTQMSLDVLFQSLDGLVQSPDVDEMLISSLTLADPSEAQVVPASAFLECVYGDPTTDRATSRATSRAQTPMMSRAQTPMTVGRDPSLSPFDIHPTSSGLYPHLPQVHVEPLSPIGKIKVTPTIRLISPEAIPKPMKILLEKPKPLLPSQLPFWNSSRITESVAKLKFGYLKDYGSIVGPPSSTRRPKPPRLSALPQTPDVSEFAMDVDSNADYAVVVSMYEVYNDRIFDLLSSSPMPTLTLRSLRHTQTGSKDNRRRPLLFKSTEISPDRKVVAGLRKIVCSSYEEAMMVLETGLMERRVTGTGSNSVSSRSHGFFCVEVRKRKRSRRPGVEQSWSGSTLTVVDLAGSERARNAKTAGATLAEAGKINESLMYLGQCLQVQSEAQDGNRPAIVPFRQCKLTELLFSNSFPSHAPSSHHRTPQKAVMIVTADPHGDFNATSQILRYSALAREVTVPRIPSVTSTILSGTTASARASRCAGTTMSGRSTPNPLMAEELELAIAEIARLSEDLDVLSVRLAEEEIAREEAETARRAAEERAENIEMDVREECWEEMEQKIEEERRRWKGAWSAEADKNDEHLDKKLEILSRGISIYEDVPESSADDHVQELEDENADLRRKLDALERELHCRSPTKTTRPRRQNFENHKPILTQRGLDIDNTVYRLGNMSLDDSGTLGGNENEKKAEMVLEKKAKTPRTGHKQRKLATRKWDLGTEDQWSP